MLTESEKQWLEKRAKKWAKFCDVCIVGNENCKLTYFRKKCPTNIQAKDLLDAAEFSERVAVKLAQVFMAIIDAEFDYELPSNCAACPCKGKCSLDCKDSIMKWARLEVEEEMDADTE